MKTIADAVQGRLGNGYSVKFLTVDGLNQQKRTGITITGSDRHLSPMIYLEEFIPAYISGVPLEEIADGVIQIYHEHIRDDYDTASFFDFGTMKDKIVYQLINTSKNKDYLAKIPHIPFFDLSIIFKAVVNSHVSDSFASTVIRNSHLELWNVTTEEIFTHARENTPKLLPYEIQKMGEIVEEYSPGSLDDSMDIGAYVITNHMRQYGCGCILYPDALSGFASAVGSFYMIPSSIHEFILIPEDDGKSQEDLLEILHTINRDELPAEDFLSDNIYFYDKETNQITQITEVTL